METPGQLLKAGRIQSSKTLDEIAEATKIRRGLLEAIEEDRNELLPPRTYLRGMVKLYAEEVGADVDEVLDRFDAVKIDKTGAEEKKDIKRQHQPASPRTYIPLLLIIVMAFLVYIFLISRSGVQDEPSRIAALPDQSAPRATAPAAPAAAVTPAKPAEGSAAPSPAAAGAPAVTPAPAALQPAGPFTIRFEAQALTWMRIQPDEEQHFDILLRPGESYKHSAARTMQVRLGNAGGVCIFFNDRYLGTAGKAGEVINLQFPDALQQLQQTQPQQ
jgi:cytoskeletal protein RodZ